MRRKHGPEAQTEVRPVVNRKDAGASPVRAAESVRRNRVGQCPAAAHTRSSSGATPGPGIRGRVRKIRQSGQVESLVILWVQFPPRLIMTAGCPRSAGKTGRGFVPIVVRRRRTARSIVRAARPMGGRRHRKPEIGVRLAGGPLALHFPLALKQRPLPPIDSLAANGAVGAKHTACKARSSDVIFHGADRRRSLLTTEIGLKFRCVNSFVTVGGVRVR